MYIPKPQADHALDHQGDIIIVLHISPVEKSADDQSNTPVVSQGEPSNQPNDSADAEAVAELNASVNDVESRSVRYRVSSRHLCLASRVFRTMLEGPWKEKRGTSNAPLEMSTTQWDPDAFLIVLQIIHGQHRSVPRTVTMEQLRDIAIIVDYYQCHEAIEIFADFWVPGVQKDCQATSLEEALPYLFIASVFHAQDLFRKTATAVVSYAKGPLDTRGLPIPTYLISRLIPSRACSFTVSS